MHIAFLNPQGNFDAQDHYWTEHPDFGGQLVYVKELAIAMAALGHQVDLLTRQISDPDWPEFAAPQDAYPGVRGVRILRISCGPPGFLQKEHLWPYLGSEWVPNILEFYEGEGSLPQAFTAHYGDGGLAAALLTYQTGYPFTFTAHSLGAQKIDKLGVTEENLSEIDARYHFKERLLAERVSMNAAGRVITSTSQERLEQYGHRAYRLAIDPGDDSRFAVIPPGVNRRVFSPQPGALDAMVAQRLEQALIRDLPPERRDLPLVLVSSRLDAKKNHLGVVRAFANHPNLRTVANLAIAVRSLEDPLREYGTLTPGEKTVMNEIVAVIAQSDLWEAVTAFPLNSQMELAAAYRVLAERRSVFALTSLYEPFGLAPLEAMSCGLPAVVTRNGGPSESLQENGREFGVLVDPTQPKDIVRGLLRILGSSQNWAQFQQAGIERVVRKYTWERTAEGYLQVITDFRDQTPSGNRLEIPPWFIEPTPENKIPLETLSRFYFGS